MTTTITASGVTFGTGQSLNDPGGTAPMYTCRAWVNFNGTGTTATNQTIRAQGNVSTVYKNGTGDYTANFATAMADTNYCITGGSGDATNANQTFILGLNLNYSTGSCRFRTGSGGGYNDNAWVQCLIHR